MASFSIDFVNIGPALLNISNIFLRVWATILFWFLLSLALSDKLLLRRDEKTYFYGCNYVKFTIYSDVLWKITLKTDDFVTKMIIFGRRSSFI